MVEWAKVSLRSVTEGSDKRDKYRQAFFIADTVVITKIDLAPFVDFDVEKASADIQALNPRVNLLRLSAKTGEGLDSWYDWVRERVLR